MEKPATNFMSYKQRICISHHFWDMSLEVTVAAQLCSCESFFWVAE